MGLTAADRVIAGVVTYNTEIATLTKTLESLRSSEYPVKITVLCNSPVESYQIKVVELCSAMGVNCMHHQLNLGFGAGHNRIVSESTGDWYICCNPDVVVEKSAIGALIDFAKCRHDAVLVCPQVLYPDGRIQPLSRRHLTFSNWLHRQCWRLSPKFFKPFEVTFDYAHSQKAEFVSGCFFLISVEKYQDLGGFDEEFFLYAEDADLSWRASKIGVNYFVAESKIIHIWSTNLARSPRALLHEFRSLIILFMKRLNAGRE